MNVSGYITFQVAVQSHAILREYSTHFTCACFAKTPMVLFERETKTLYQYKSSKGLPKSNIAPLRRSNSVLERSVGSPRLGTRRRLGCPSPGGRSLGSVPHGKHGPPVPSPRRPCLFPRSLDMDM